MASASGQRKAAVYAAEQLAGAGAANEGILRDGYADARQDVVDNGNTAESRLNGGFDTARREYAYARDYLQPYAGQGTTALAHLGDAFGVNGADGSARASAAFKASPGYAWDVDQQTDAIARKSAALGVAGSGNTLAAIGERAHNLADKEWSSYTGGLSNLANMGLNASGQQANITKGAGDLNATQGTAGAQLWTNRGTTLGNLDTGLASGLASNNMAVATGQSNAVMEAGKATDAAKNANENLLLGAIGLGLQGTIGAKKAGFF